MVVLFNNLLVVCTTINHLLILQVGSSCKELKLACSKSSPNFVYSALYLVVGFPHFQTKLPVLVQQVASIIRIAVVRGRINSPHHPISSYSFYSSSMKLWELVVCVVFPIHIQNICVGVKGSKYSSCCVNPHIQPVHLSIMLGDWERTHQHIFQRNGVDSTSTNRRNTLRYSVAQVRRSRS